MLTSVKTVIERTSMLKLNSPKPICDITITRGGKEKRYERVALIAIGKGMISFHDKTSLKDYLILDEDMKIEVVSAGFDILEH